MISLLPCQRRRVLYPQDSGFILTLHIPWRLRERVRSIGGTRQPQSVTNSHSDQPSLHSKGCSWGKTMGIQEAWKSCPRKLHAPASRKFTTPKASVLIRKYEFPNLSNKDDTSLPLSFHLQESAIHRHCHGRGVDLVSPLWQTAVIQLYGGPNEHARPEAKSGAFCTTSTTD